MKNPAITIIAGDIGSVLEVLRRMEPVARGWTRGDAEHEEVSAVIDEHRFGSMTDSVLARYEGDEGHAYFPSAEELEARGIDIGLLAAMLEAGMVEAESFNETLRHNSAATVNGALEHLLEIALENLAQPDPIDRILARHGEAPVSADPDLSAFFEQAFDILRGKSQGAPRREDGPYSVSEVFVVRV